MRIIGFSIIFFLLQVTTFLTVAQGIKKTELPKWVIDNATPLNFQHNKQMTSGYYYLLLDRQYNLVTEERYYKFAYKILSAEGVQQMSNISVEFDPAFQSLRFHSISVTRNSTRTDKLSTAEIKTIQREEGMDRYLYDGAKTTYINLSDVRVGDVIEYSYTVTGFNPVLGNHFSEYLYFDYSFPYQKLFQRVVLPTNRKFNFFYRNGEVTPQIKRHTLNEYVWEQESVDAVLIDENSPGWFDPFRYLVISSFNSWSEVNEWALSQFTFPDQSDKLKRALPPDLFEGTIAQKMGKAIRFVQDEIRYLGFENGIHSHKPHPPIQVLEQRFGDCKDKSLLLSAIIKLQGAQAYPILVNSILQHKILDEPPSHSVFDHCVVQIMNGTETIYVDPTMSNQGGLYNSVYFPRYGAGLVISKDTKNLTKIESLGHAEILEEQFFSLEELRGKAQLRIVTTYKGYEADWQRTEFSRNDLHSTQKGYLTFYGNLYPEIEVVDSLRVTDNRDENIFTVEESYEIPTFWKDVSDSEDQIYCEFYPQSLEKYLNVNKLMHRTAPYRLSHPLSFKHVIYAKLPEAWTINDENKVIESDYYRFENNVSYKNDELKLERHYMSKKAEVPVDAIGQFVKDHQEMMALISYNLSYNTAFKSQSPSSIGHWIIVLGSIALGSILVLRVQRFDPENSSVDDSPIGGWLVLVAIGLCITPIRLLIDLFNSENNFFNLEVWNGLISMKRWDLYSLLTGELCFNIVFLFFTGVLIIHFFQRRTSVPVLMTFFYGTSLLVTIIDAALASTLLDTSWDNSMQQILQSFIGVVIWIPYFHFSERVKETFTRRL